MRAQQPDPASPAGWNDRDEPESRAAEPKQFCAVVTRVPGGSVFLSDKDVKKMPVKIHAPCLQMLQVQVQRVHRSQRVTAE